MRISVKIMLPEKYRMLFQNSKLIKQSIWDKNQDSKTIQSDSFSPRNFVNFRKNYKELFFRIMNLTTLEKFI